MIAVHAVAAPAKAPATARTVNDVGLKDAPLPSLFPPEPAPAAAVSAFDATIHKMFACILTVQTATCILCHCYMQGPGSKPFLSTCTFAGPTHHHDSASNLMMY
jgi:hypothetical protein